MADHRVRIEAEPPSSSRGDLEPLASALRHRVAMLDRGPAIESLQPLAQSLAATLERRRFGALLLTLFAGLVMTLAGVGRTVAEFDASRAWWIPPFMVDSRWGASR